MNFQTLSQYIQQEFGVVADYPWSKFPDYAVFRHGEGKWFCLYMPVPAQKLNIPGEAIYHLINVKSRPEMIGTLRTLNDIFPAYHMNKEHWISVRIDGQLETSLIEDLIAESFTLTQ